MKPATSALAAFHAVTSTLFRPTLNAALPSVARTPDELVAANGASLTLESAGTLAGPIVGAGLFALVDAGAVFAVGTGVYSSALLLVAGVRLEGVPQPSGRASAARVTSEFFAGLRLVATEPQPRLLIGLFGVQTVVRGALNVLIVVMVFRLLRGGEQWVGILTAALGVGGLAGAFSSIRLAGRPLAGPFGLGLVLWGLPIALIPVWPSEAWAFLMIAAVGAGNSVA